MEILPDAIRRKLKQNNENVYIIYYILGIGELLNRFYKFLASATPLSGNCSNLFNLVYLTKYQPQL